MNANPADTTLATFIANPFDGVSYYMPANDGEVIDLVNKAHQEKAVVCLRGAAHSHPLISDLEAEPPARIYMMLSRMNAVTFNDALKQVTVEGGCHLGVDPSDPTGTSTLENSLLYQLDQHRTDPANPLDGWAIPDLGGITHQTVGGFLSTGSSGSSLNDSFNEQLVSLTLITGGPNGAQKQTFSRVDPRYPNEADNPFFAVGVSLGLVGVIVSATFQCVVNFNIVGQETTTLVDDCPIDLFGDNPARQSLADFFKGNSYKRMMWWPEKGVDKMVVWTAEPVSNSDNFKPKPYQEIPEVVLFGVSTPVPAELVADLMFSGFADIPVFLRKVLGRDSLLYKQLIALGRDKIVPLLLNQFVKVDGIDGPQKFQDVWYKGIPMDDRISDYLIPVRFTELWFPLSSGPSVLQTLKTFFTSNPDKTGTFSYEIYPAKASKFWMSPAYQTDVFRIDIFWFGNNPGSPADAFYPAFWNLLQSLEFRPHWGKFLPASDSNQGVSYLRARYPNFDRWLDLRNDMDPHQVFVSDYWRHHLGITKPV